jgi:hypothetical protein
VSDENPKGVEFPEGVFAFPLSVVYPDGRGGTHIHARLGMTLRDYFAGQALAGACAKHGLDLMRPDEVASNAYRMADLMLAARGGK